jgi:pantoate--beta-alanine ligase
LELLNDWRGQGQSIALVPTMGALHAGHGALMNEAKQIADKVVVSIFINPKQFGQNEDFARYPVTPEDDIALMQSVGVDAAWVPTADEIYPSGFATNIHVAGISEGLCGAHRPGHFDGVATVVSKLLHVVLPDVAIFGEKDYQQLCVIQRMVADLALPIEIMGMATIREADGLALSSRNRYLSAEQRTQAAALYAVLRETEAMLRAGVSVGKATEEGKVMLAKRGFSKVEYLEYRAENDLTPLAQFTQPSRLLAAAWLGNTRLIDNIEI